MFDKLWSETEVDSISILGGKKKMRVLKNTSNKEIKRQIYR